MLFYFIYSVYKLYLSGLLKQEYQNQSKVQLVT